MIGLYESKEFFQKEKSRILEKKDNSKIGSIDKEIKPILDLINSKSDYCTTSSCAGRITLLERKSGRKNQANWLLSSHSKIRPKDISDNLMSKHDVWLMQQSFILHVFCRNLESAGKLISVFNATGIKRAGIVTFRKKIIVEAFGNDNINSLVVKNGKKLIDNEYVKIIAKECNLRLDKNTKILAQFYSKLKSL